MSVEGWKYYNHAAIPTTAPHEEPNLEPIKNKLLWSGMERKPFLIRWISNWDCGFETEWWYCIKDTPLDISTLKSKRRYEINKGKKNFEFRKINPQEFKDELYKVTVVAYSGWPKKYRPKVNEIEFKKSLDSWQGMDIFGGFDMETDELCGYAMLVDNSSYVEFSVLRTNPDFEKKAINAAMVAGILDYYRERFDGKFYINDGSRAIRHETAFQDYLEKYFDFRKAFCRLNIMYRPGFKWMVKALYPFRKFIKSNSNMGNMISGILKMEEISRSF